MTLSHSYILVQNTYFFHDQLRVSYGVAVVMPDEAYGTVIKTISNISCDRMAMAKLVELCNARGLSPIHLEDVIEDFLS